MLIAFGDAADLRLSVGGDYGWVSHTLGVKVPAPLVRIERRCVCPAKFITLIDFSGRSPGLRLAIHPDLKGADGIYESGATTLFKWNEACI